MALVQKRSFVRRSLALLPASWHLSLHSERPPRTADCIQGAFLAASVAPLTAYSFQRRTESAPLPGPPGWPRGHPTYRLRPRPHWPCGSRRLLAIRHPNHSLDHGNLRRIARNYLTTACRRIVADRAELS